MAGEDYLIVGGTTSTDGVAVQIVGSLSHLGFDIELLNNDIQSLLLAESVPTGSEFVKVNCEGSIPADSAFVRTAGYGYKEGTTLPEQSMERFSRWMYLFRVWRNATQPMTMQSPLRCISAPAMIRAVAISATEMVTAVFIR